MLPEEWVIWGYRILLGREPEDGAAVRRHVTPDFSPDVLRRRLLASAEFKALAPPEPSPLDPEAAELQALKAAFATPARAREEGFFVDFLGVRTRCSYLPPSYAQFSGTVEQADGSGQVPLHEPAEMIALLRSAREGQGPFTVVELGAGWGPWLAAGAAAGRHAGRPVHLVGVEGDAGHFRFMQTHLADNGIDPEGGPTLLQAVVAAQDGTMRFPILPDPSADWGASALPPGAAPGSRASVELTAVSVRTLLKDLPRADHLHCDIQGHEADALEASAEMVDAKVRRVVVGTHGRAIEERLFGLFGRLGWVLEHEKACRFDVGSAGVVLANDGVQVWRNPAFP